MSEQYGNTDGLESTAAPQKNKFGPGPLALPRYGPTRHEHGAGYRGLGRMKLREVWEAAKLDGLEIPYPQFRVYVARLRRRRQKPSQSLPGQPLQQTSAENA